MVPFKGKVAGPEVGAFLLTCSPEDWNGHLDTVGHPRQAVPMKRQHYVCREMVYDWQGHLPEGYTLHPMTADLLKRTDLQLPEAVRTTLGKWRSIQDERFQDYGFVVLYENQAVAWATTDFVLRLGRPGF